IAVLSEANTVYGAGAREAQAKRGGVRSIGEQKAARAEEEKKDGIEEDAAGPPILSLPFPMNIAEVGATFDQRLKEKDQKLRLPLGPQRLPIPFDAEIHDRAAPRPFDNHLTSVSVEILLSEILDVVNREGVSHVGIVATDARDIIFLACFVRQYCPDVQ